MQLTHALYKVRWLTVLGAGKTVSYRIVTNPPPQAYWCDNADVESVTVLQQIADSVHWEVSVEEVIGSDKVKAHLVSNTREAVQRGAFGVPRLVMGSLALHTCI